MQKPSTIVYREFSDNLQDLLNNAGLPAFVMIPLMREALTQLEVIEQRQYQRDLEEWNKALEADSEAVDADGKQTDQ